MSEIEGKIVSSDIEAMICKINLANEEAGAQFARNQVFTGLLTAQQNMQVGMQWCFVWMQEGAQLALRKIQQDWESSKSAEEFALKLKRAVAASALTPPAASPEPEQREVNCGPHGNG